MHEKILDKICSEPIYQMSQRSNTIFIKSFFSFILKKKKISPDATNNFSLNITAYI